jgi:hypothetical protein
MKKAILIATLAGAALTVPTLGQFGFGVTVFDPTSWGELVSQLQQMQQQYSLLTQTYSQITNQYRQMQTNATLLPINMLARYRAVLSPWKFTAAGNTYGTTGGWVTSINSGAGAVSGYGAATTPLQNYSTVWNSIPADQQEQIKRNYSTLEIKDGTNVNSITTLGTIRSNAPQVENAISGLEADSLSSDPNLNTEVGVLNKINAANLISIRNTQDSNKLLASVLEQQLAAEKARRDAEAQSVNNQIAFQAQQGNLIQQHMTGTTAVLTGFNIP